MLVINPFVHVKTKLSRQQFLSRVSSVKGIRTSVDEFFTVYLHDIDSFMLPLYLQAAIRNGSFDGLDGFYGRVRLFGVEIGRKLHEWLDRTDIDTVRRQIILWLAAMYWQETTRRHIMRRQLYGPVVEEIERLQSTSFSEPATDDPGQNEAHYLEISHSYVGAGPPELLEKLMPPGLWIPPGEWSVHQAYEPFDLALRRIYFTATDWKDVVDDGDDDDLLRSESSTELWDKWKLQFASYDERATSTYSLFGGNPARGSVYVIRESGSDRYKIGYTSGSPRQRLAKLKTGNAVPLELVGSFRVVGPQTERMLHRVFSSSRLTGEWFRLKDDEVEQLLDEDWRRAHSIF
jgi:hypothetical protein